MKFLPFDTIYRSKEEELRRHLLDVKSAQEYRNNHSYLQACMARLQDPAMIPNALHYFKLLGKDDLGHRVFSKNEAEMIARIREYGIEYVAAFNLIVRNTDFAPDNGDTPEDVWDLLSEKKEVVSASVVNSLKAIAGSLPVIKETDGRLLERVKIS